MNSSYYTPVRYPAWESETRKGLGKFLKALYLAVIVMLISGLVMGFVLKDLSGLGDIQDESDVAGILGSLIILGIVGIVMLVAGLAALILFIMGLVGIHRGKSEFGPAHEASVRLALIFLIMTIVISVIGGAAAAAMAFSSISFTDQAPQDMFGFEDGISRAGIVSGAIGIVSAVFQYLFLVYLVKELAGPDTKNRLWTGFGLGVASSVVSLIITALLLSGWVLTSPGGLETAVYTSVIPTAVSLLALVIFITCFRDVISRIDSGEIKPVPPPMPYWPAPPPPPVWPQ